jgi:hypothetical protein
MTIVFTPTILASGKMVFSAVAQAQAPHILYALTAFVSMLSTTLVAPAEDLKANCKYKVASLNLESFLAHQRVQLGAIVVCLLRWIFTKRC